MPTLRSIKGLSLFELLIVLAMLSLAAGITLFSMTSALNANKLRFVTDQLVTDLKHTRLQAERSGETLEFHVTRYGYTAPKLDIQREFNAKVSFQLDPDTTLRFYHNGQSTGGSITVRSHKKTINVQVSQLDGKITQTI